MARQFITARLNSLFAQAVRRLNTELDKRHRFEVLISAETYCPNCNYDRTNRCSSGVYKPGGPQPFTGMVCPVCKTKGVIRADKRRRVIANVQLGTHEGEADVPFPEGVLPIGYAYVKSNFENKATLEKAVAFYIDNLRYSRVDFPLPSGLQTLVSVHMYLKRDA